MKLLMPYDVDRLLRYPKGKSKRLARKKLIPHVQLPDGEIRFDEQDIERLLQGDWKVTPRVEVAHVA